MTWALGKVHAHKRMAERPSCGPCQVDGGKVTNPKDMDKLRSALEKLVGTSLGRTLSRSGSLKRPVVGEAAPADQKKALLYKLKGEPLLLVPPTQEDEIELFVRQPGRSAVWGLASIAWLQCMAKCGVQSEWYGWQLGSCWHPRTA
jgi:hypothetical protein